MEIGISQAHTERCASVGSDFHEIVSLIFGSISGHAPEMRPLRILGAVSAGFGLAAEALYNSAERRKNHSHTLIRIVKIGIGQARTQCAGAVPDFYETKS